MKYLIILMLLSGFIYSQDSTKVILNQYKKDLKQMIELRKDLLEKVDKASIVINYLQFKISEIDTTHTRKKK